MRNPESNLLQIKDGSRMLVVGLGVSGFWSAKWLAGQGAYVTVSDIRPKRDLNPDMLKELEGLGIKLEAGGHERETFLGAELIVVSPGVPHTIDLLRMAVQKNIPVMGELELASRMIDTPMIAVTGTNGKSTVTALLGRMLENAGYEVFVGGNIGTPLIAYVAGKQNADYAVVEVSSFQLDTIEKFCPFISIVLNISPDHLSRYSNYEDYVRSKLRIFKNQTAGQYVIFNDDDERLSFANISSGASLLRYGFEKKENRHAFIDNTEMWVSQDNRQEVSFSLKSFSLPGTHNLENLMPVALSGQVLGIDRRIVQTTIDESKGLPHRLEFVAELEGVIFYDDSKATNIDAAVRAITSFDRPLILIAGGRHKGADYFPLVKASEGRIKKAVFIGETKALLAESFKDTVPFSLAEDLEEAVSVSFEFAERGDVVLLSPACSSFDMFSNYSHRGNMFKTAVEGLVRG